MNVGIINAIREKEESKQLSKLLKEYQNESDFFPFHEAVKANNSDAIKVLKQCKHNFNINSFKSYYLKKLNSNFEVTPLMLAISKEDLTSINMLIKQGADVNLGTKNPDGFKPLQYAIIIGNNDIIKALIKAKGYTFNKSDFLFHYAIEYSNLDAIKIIGKKCKDINEYKMCDNLLGLTNSHQVTPLMLAISKKDLNSVIELIDQGTDINLGIDNHPDGFKPLPYAIHIGAINIAAHLKGAKKLSFYDKLNGSLGKNIRDDIVEKNTINYSLSDLINNHLVDISESDNDKDLKSLIIEQCKNGNILLESNLNNNEFKKIIGKLLTIKTSTDQKGRRTELNGAELIRERHSYANERERQRLRHIATQVYFALEYHGAKNLIEVQVMHMKYGDNHNLFIAVNQIEVSKHFEKIFSKNNLCKLLIFEYNPSCQEGIARSKRYSSKLKKRVFDVDIQLNQEINDDDEQMTKKVGDILKKNNVFSFDIKYLNSDLATTSKSLLDKIKSEGDKIFFVAVEKHPYKKRHAEEFLCDIAEYMKNSSQNINIHTSIAGKKRPCMGCSGRMKEVGITKVSDKPGRFWVHTLENQSAKAAKKTIEVLLKERSHLSECKSGLMLQPLTDYDSASNSDDDDEKIPKFSI